MAAIDTLVEHRPRFLGFVRARLDDRRDAEDLLQDAFAKVLNGSAVPPDDERVIPWFYRVLRNAISDRHRRTDVAQRRLDAFARDPTTSPSAAIPRRLCACTLRALASLKPRYEQIVTAVDVEGERVVEFAARHALSATNAAVRLHRARRLLSERLRAICQSCAVDQCGDCHCSAPRPRGRQVPGLEGAL